jgi:hypothetical protein
MEKKGQGVIECTHTSGSEKVADAIGVQAGFQTDWGIYLSAK